MRIYNTEVGLHQTRKTMSSLKSVRRLRRQECATRMKPYIIRLDISSSLQL
jgi:hypothetical protein